ncbi:MAG: fluoride efflux transporter CrcB [Bacteroidetes bacterium]|nr:MAG: fluoride efflux transporter CrcB [Bacteroidota bacterium]
MYGYLLVFLGGGLGSLVRFSISKILAPYSALFPWATFAANAISCVVLGMLVGMNLRGHINDSFRLLLMTGFCGGFSTFSTFTNETFYLFQTGHIFYGLSNIFLSLGLCLFCIYLGIKIIS